MAYKVWVKRPGASATLVSIREDDLVDDVRDMILKKYANSLGRSFDAPDVTLRIVTRPDEHAQRSQTERLLGPEEDMCQTLNRYYPGGQTVEEALIIDVPVKQRTPRAASPHQAHHHAAYAALDDYRPRETGNDYFPPMPAITPGLNPQLNLDSRLQPHHSTSQVPEHTRSLSVLATGQVPPLPSPGAIARRHREHRPKYGRQHTASPTILTHPSNAGAAISAKPPHLVPQSHAIPHRSSVRGRRESIASELPNGAPIPPPLPTPPASDAAPTANPLGTPPLPSSRDISVLRAARPRRTRKTTPTGGAQNSNGAVPSYSSLLDNSVPPINVLIVEDNIINLKVLEAFMKRLRVRWSTAMNGQIAVNKWRAGGFHLVLMDIQLPIMNGLEATKEIRRLERVNGIGVFSDPASLLQKYRSKTEELVDGDKQTGSPTEPDKDNNEKDRLQIDVGLFKSPVIIVALTASSLQSDRHEALAAGCNDFLTKPVSFPWLERKVKEWGCMQALIDFDGWRQWKDFSSAPAEPAGKTAAKPIAGKSPVVPPVAGPDAAAKAEAAKKKAKRASRASLEATTGRQSMDESPVIAESNGDAA